MAVPLIRLRGSRPRLYIALPPYLPTTILNTYYLINNNTFNATEAAHNSLQYHQVHTSATFVETDHKKVHESNISSWLPGMFRVGPMCVPLYRTGR